MPSICPDGQRRITQGTALRVDTDYDKQILNYCAYDNEFSVKFEMLDGTIHNLKDVCELME